MGKRTTAIITEILINTYMQMAILILLMIPKPTRYRPPQKIRHPLHWTLNSWDEVGWKKNVRLSREEFMAILTTLDIPNGIVTENRYKCDPETALAIMMYRIHYPCRLCDMRVIFNGWSEAKISAIDNHMIDLFYDQYSYLLRWKEKDWTVPKMKRYDHSIRRKEAPAKRVIAFMDATSRFICRPCRDQEVMYSGHKKCHCFKVQTVATPDGITRIASDCVAGSFCPAPCQLHCFLFGALGMFGDDGAVCEGVMDDNGVVM